MRSMTAFFASLYVKLYDNLLEAQYSAHPHVEQNVLNSFSFLPLFKFFFYKEISGLFHSSG